VFKHVILAGIFSVLAATTVCAQIIPDAGRRSVPEPSSVVLLLSGLGGGAAWLWRKRK
jgi:hypothetical protein